MERRSAVRGRCEGGPRPRRGGSALGSWQGVRSGTPRAGDGAPRWGGRWFGRSCPGSVLPVVRATAGRRRVAGMEGVCGPGAVAGSVARVSRRRRWSAVRATDGRCRLAGLAGADGPGAAVGASAGSVVRATAGRRRLIRGWAAPGDRAPRWGGRRFSRPAPTNPALQPPAACTRARITRTSSPISGCHWTPRTQGDDGSSIASTVPSAAWAVGIRPSPSRSTAWWW